MTFALYPIFELKSSTKKYALAFLREIRKTQNFGNVNAYKIMPTTLLGA